MSMPERVLQTTGEVLPEYRQDLPETAEPSRLCEPLRISGGAEDLSGRAAQPTGLADASVKQDLAIGVGEDPGWRRSRRARSGKDRPGVTALQSV
jgi:hypothetical protein